MAPEASTEVFDQRLGTETPYLCTKYVVWSVWVSQAARGLAPCEDTGRICAGVSCRGGAIRDFCRACQFKFRECSYVDVRSVPFCELHSWVVTDPSPLRHSSFCRS